VQAVGQCEQDIDGNTRLASLCKADGISMQLRHVRKSLLGQTQLAPTVGDFLTKGFNPIHSLSAAQWLLKVSRSGIINEQKIVH